MLQKCPLCFLWELRLRTESTYLRFGSALGPWARLGGSDGQSGHFGLWGLGKEREREDALALLAFGWIAWSTGEGGRNLAFVVPADRPILLLLEFGPPLICPAPQCSNVPCIRSNLVLAGLSPSFPRFPGLPVIGPI